MVPFSHIIVSMVDFSGYIHFYYYAGKRFAKTYLKESGGRNSQDKNFQGFLPLLNPRLLWRALRLSTAVASNKVQLGLVIKFFCNGWHKRQTEI